MPNFFNKYPYTDFHELNLDWILETIKNVVQEWADTLTAWNNTQQAWHDEQEAFQDLHDYVMNYFNNLNVQTEINNKLDQMADDGSLDAILLPYFNAYKTTINDMIALQNDSIANLESRMSTFTQLAEGSTTGDAELMDARVPATGFHDNLPYDTAGDAIRGQITTVQNEIDIFMQIVDIALNRPGYINASGSVSINAGWFHSDYIPIGEFIRTCNINWTSSTAKTFAFYDKDFTFISGIGNAGTAISQYTLAEADIPAGTAYVVITQKVLATDVGRLIQRYIINRSFRVPANNLYFSFDDCLFWKNLIDYEASYTSCFDEPFLADLKDLHDKYGMKFSLYCFSTDGAYDIYNVPSKWAMEFSANSDWLKFGFHSVADGYNYSIDRPGAASQYDNFVRGIYHMTGNWNSIDRCIRLANFAGTLNNVKAFRDAYSGIQALMCADDSRDSYYLNADQNAFIQTHSYYYDAENQILFVKTQSRLDNLGTPSTYNQIEYSNFRQNLAFFVHQHVWSGTVKARVESFAEWAIINDFKFTFVMDEFK